MRKFILLTCFLWPAMQACSPAPRGDAPPLAPGTMRMISVEQVEDFRAASLLSNRAFEEWSGGLPAPTGFQAPATTSDSTVTRDAKAGHLGATGYTVRQVWSGPGAGAEPGENFGTTVSLKANTHYRLEVIASATAGMGAGVSAVEAGATGPRMLCRSVVDVRGEAPAHFSGTFTTVAGGVVTLSSYALGDSTFPGTVFWSAWRLEETGASTAPLNVADQPERRLLVNQALDQIQGQVALYGGTASWIKATEPNRKNAARIQREEGAKGDSILGYEQFISSKAELSWFESAAGGEGASAALDAILRGERALNARGITLIAVPVPERVQLYFDHVYQPSGKLPVNLAVHAALVEQLLSRDVLVFDPAPLLWAMKSEGKHVYWRSDSEMPSATLHAMAGQVAPLLTSLGAAVPEAERKVYSIKVDTIALEQRLVPGLPEALRASVEKEVHGVQSVRDEAGELFQPAPISPVLVAGSLGMLHQLRGASFAARLSMALGFPVSLPARNLPDTEVLAYLASDAAPERAWVKFVVYCFPDQTLFQEGWN